MERVAKTSPKMKLLAALFLGTLILVEISLGIQIGSASPVLVAVALLIAVLTALVMFDTELGICLLVATLLISEDYLVKTGLPLGPGRLNVLDCLVLATLVSWLAKGLVSKNLKLTSTPLNLPILGLILLAVISAVMGISNGYDINTVLRELRPFLYLSLFFVVANSVISLEKVNRMIVVFFLVGLAVAVTDIVKYVLAFGGVIPQQLLRGEMRIFGTGEDTFFVILLLISLAILVGNYPKRVKSVISFASIPIFFALLTSIIRSNYVGLVAGGMLVVLLLKTMSKVKLTLCLIAITGGLTILVFVMTSFSLGPLFLRPVALRLETLLSPLPTSTLTSRLQEGAVALGVFRQHPVFGAGLGYPFYLAFEGLRTGFLHNDYLYILSKMGLVGAAVLALIIVFIFSRGISVLKRINSSNLRGLLAAVLAGIFAVFVISAAAPRITFIKTAPVIPILFGLIESIAQADVKVREKSERLNEA